MGDESQIAAKTDAGSNDADEHFSADEEKTLLQESNDIKAVANTHFACGDFDAALEKYDEALASCPNYRHYERAVIHSNVAACHLKLEAWESAINAATASLKELETYEVDVGLKPKPPPPEERHKSAPEATKDESGTPSDSRQKTRSSESTEGPLLAKATGQTDQPAAASVAPDTVKDDVARIRSKALLRRGRARSEAGGWQNLSGATEDYKALSGTAGLTPADKRTVSSQLRALPQRTKAAQETETAEMWGKLRQLGDGILKPFGLSTNNFQMVKDEASGGYSVNFSQGEKKGETS